MTGIGRTIYTIPAFPVEEGILGIHCLIRPTATLPERGQSSINALFSSS
jgi:hypothetical protein